MKIPIFQVDAFASGPFTGNPAAVCVLDGPRESEWMQQVAMEMNLSETSFLVPRDAHHREFDLRWFTPAIEVPLCGHATLASSHILWETARLRTDEAARFHTLSGWLTAKKSGDQIEMDFPAILHEKVALPDRLAEALGLEPNDIICNRGLGKEDSNFLLELDSEETVRNLKPNFELLRRTVNAGIIVTSRGSSSKYDFISRYFACYAGIDEDPVTGSAHCMLAPYWSAKLGKVEMLAFQASARGGEVGVRFNGERVVLIGQALTVLQGSLLC